MHRRRTFYLVHRWVGLIVSLQLLTWSLSGFTFTILDIDNVHGDLERNTDPPPAVRAERALLTPDDALAAAAASGIARETVTRISLRERFGRTTYELFDGKRQPLTAVDAVSGKVIPRITQEEATAAARADFAPTAAVASAGLLEGEAPLEYRGGPMPVYQIVLDHPKEPHLYVSPVTGRVLTRRNRPWRIFDFFWMLHIMDYGRRENFNHWLLTGMSALAILTSASGLALWLWRVPRRKRN